MKTKGKIKAGGRTTAEKKSVRRDASKKKLSNAMQDITERKQTDENLAEQERLIRAVAGTAPAIIYVYDMALQANVYANDGIQRILGYLPQEIQAMGADLFANIVHPDDLPEAIAFQQRIFEAADDDVLEIEYRMKHRHGGWRSLHSFERPFLRNADGSIRQKIGVAMDITERKRVEDELRLSNERFFNAFHTSPAGLTITRIADGKFIDVNEAFLRMFEFTREEVIGHTSTELNILSLEERAKLIQAQIESGGLRNAELISRAKSGRLVHLLFSSKPMELGGEPHHITTMIDITERKRAQEALMRQQELLQKIMDNIPVLIVYIDKDGHTQWVNRHWERTLGWTLDQAISRDIVADMYPDPAIRGQIAEFIKAGLGVWRDFQTITKDGKMIETAWANVTLSDGTSIGIGQDITDRKQVEEELRLSRDRLADLSRQLVNAHEAESRAIGRELHDQIGQLLTALKITMETAISLPPEQAREKNKKGQELIVELMNRVSHLSLELRPSMLDDLGLIPALLWHIQRFQEQARIQVDFKHNCAEGQRFDPEIETTAYRVVQESLTNVARHAHATQVRINVRATEGTMDIRIEDNGAGFDPQTALAKNRGLSGMRERVSLLGGTFQIESKAGEGTKKRVQIPLNLEHAQ